MPISSVDTYRTMLAAPSGLVHSNKTALTTPALRLVSHFVYAGTTTGVAPSTAVVPTNLTAGSLGQSNAPGGTEQFLTAAQVDSMASGTTLQAGFMILFDRLSHQGGLVANVATTQTTNLPTAALTRYTSGAGVWAFVEVYSLIGTTATSFTASYTNQAGTSGRTSAAQLIGAVGWREQGRLLPLALQSGDSGVRSVESVTLAATTGTAGNIGVVLAKPLLILPIAAAGDPFLRTYLNGGLGGGIPKIEDNACLFWAHFTTSGTTQLVQTTQWFGTT